ncbi:hypothetical protein D3C72_2586780 [compost metagenome]
MRALYVKRTAGVSCDGTHERALMLCDWLNMKGSLPDMVCCGVSHCSAMAFGAV